MTAGHFLCGVNVGTVVIVHVGTVDLRAGTFIASRTLSWSHATNRSSRLTVALISTWQWTERNLPFPLNGRTVDMAQLDNSSPHSATISGFGHNEKLELGSLRYSTVTTVELRKMLLGRVMCSITVHFRTILH